LKRKFLLKRVADDFHEKIMRRRDLRLKEHYELNGINVESKEQMGKLRVFTHWRMRCQDKQRKRTVVQRYLAYKSRLSLLRCMLSWR